MGGLPYVLIDLFSNNMLIDRVCHFIAIAHRSPICIDCIVFPGGFLPTVTLLLNSLHTGAHGKFIVDSIVNIGPHYARTLREWRKRFLANFDAVVVPALIKEYPETMGGERGRREIEVFKRKWICE